MFESFISSLTSMLTKQAASIHKYAALSIGLLGAMGITPGSTADNHLLAVVGVAYAAVVHAFDQISAAVSPVATKAVPTPAAPVSSATAPIVAAPAPAPAPAISG